MKIKTIILSILVVHLLFLIGLKFTAWPEMLLWPYLMSHGWLPYTNIAIAHTPLLLVFLSVFFKVFGAGILQLKIFTWILILLLDLLVYFAAKRLWNQKVGILAVTFFAVFITLFDGNGLWFDLFMGAFALLAFYFSNRKRWVWTGVFFALALLSKQTAIYFLIPIGLQVLFGTKDKFQSLVKTICGILIVGFIFTFSLFIFGLLPDFYNWAISFGIFILPRSQGQIMLPGIKSLLVALFPFLSFLFLYAVDKKFVLRDKLLLLCWAGAGILGAYPRFEYFHFQPAIPFLAFCVGLIIADAKNIKGVYKAFLILFFLGTLYLAGQYFIRNWREGTRFFETDVSDVANFVKSNTSPGDRIFVMNWWDNIYALTDTTPATNPWVPQLFWYQELNGIQEKEVENLRSENPKMIILNPYTESGLSSYKPQKLYDFVSENYKLYRKIDGIEILTPR